MKITEKEVNEIISSIDKVLGESNIEEDRKELERLGKAQAKNSWEMTKLLCGGY